MLRVCGQRVICMLFHPRARVLLLRLLPFHLYSHFSVYL